MNSEFSSYAVHEPGEDFWLWDLMSPLSLATHKIPYTGLGHLHLHKKVIGTAKSGIH